MSRSRWIALGVAVVALGCVLVTQLPAQRSAEPVYTTPVAQSAALPSAGTISGRWTTRRATTRLPGAGEGRAPDVVYGRAGEVARLAQRETETFYVDELVTSRGRQNLAGRALRPTFTGPDELTMAIEEDVAHRSGLDKRASRRETSGRVSVMVIGTDGRVRRRWPIAAAGYIFAIDFVVNARGDMAVLWAQCADEGACLADQQLRVAARPAGRATFREPVLLSAGSEGDARTSEGLAINARGDVVAAYIGAGGQVAARVGHVDAGFGPERSLGDFDGAAQIEPAINDRGRIAVAWATQDPGMEIADPTRVQVATGHTQDGRFDPSVKLLDPGPPGQRSDSGVAVAVAADGSVAVLWSQPTGLWFALSASDGVLRTSRRLIRDRTGGDVAVGPDGRLAVVWAAPEDLVARVREPNGEPGPPELVVRDADVFPFDLRYDTRTDTPVVSRLDRRVVLRTERR